jgi:3-hydroxyisobutyrate dehydrogenase-like beta-hydroxyacid dehydrogenase
MQSDIKTKNQQIGFIGIGNMGMKMAKWLLMSGYPMLIFDIDNEKLELIKSDGAMIASGIAEVVKKCDIVMTSLPLSEVWVDVAEEYFIPNARAGQIFIDMGTVTPPETRRIAGELKKKNAVLIDCPISNSGPTLNDKLHLFIGGEKEAVDKCWYIFETLGLPGHIVYCGGSGSGQVMKGVNQLSMGLVQAAYIEAIGFGVMSGLDPKDIMQAIGEKGKPGFRGMVYNIAEYFAKGNAKNLAVKHGQLQHYIKEAINRDFNMPLSEKLYDFLKDSPEIIKDANRKSPSFWEELRTRKRCEDGQCK